ncbi:MAG TPA: BON domain-containing protein [Steroidobacteraceae bacterium]|nr:BON domain-containing protein [Steroidobacteraceae bacterium]
MSSTFRAAVLALTLSLGATGCSLFRAHEAATTAYVGDTAITTRVQTALIHDPHIRASEIDVQTAQGRVTLDGEVDDAAMAQRALEITRATPGVRTIDDKLTVASPSTALNTKLPQRG